MKRIANKIKKPPRKLRKTQEEVSRDLALGAQYKMLFNAMTESFALCELVFGADGKPNNYRFLKINKAFEKFTGLKRGEIIGSLRKDIPIPLSSKSFNIYCKVAITGKPARFENYNAALDKYYVVQVYSPVKNQFATIFADITENKISKEKLRENEKRYRLLVKHAPAGIYEIDFTTGRFTSVNDAMCQILGYTREELLARTALDILDPEGQKRFAARVRLAQSGKDPGKTAEYQIKTKNGRLIWSLLNATFHRKNGKIIGATVVAHDITRRKRTEEALRESEEKYRNLVKFAPAAIYEMDLRGDKLLSVNEVMCDILGYSREELLKIKPAALLDEKSETAFKKRIDKKLNGQRIDDSVEYRIRRKDGKWIDAYINVSKFTYADEKPASVIVIAHDITHRKKLENLLQTKSKEQEAILDSAPAMIFYKDKDNHFLRVNKAFGTSVGLPKGRLEGKSLFDIFPKEQADAFWKDDLYVIKSGKEKRGIIEPMNTPRGTRTVQTDKIPYLDEQGKVVGIIGFAVDITERKKTEEAFRVSELKYRRLFESAKDGILILDFETGLIMDVNPFLINWFGYTYAELLKKYIWDIGIFKDVISSKKAFSELQKKEFIRYENLPLESKSGKKMFVEFISNVYLVENKKVIQCNIRDITERKAMEQKLKESEKRYRGLFENIGEMLATFEVIRDEKGEIIDKKFIDANPATVKDAGIESIKDIIGKTSVEVYGREYTDQNIDIIRKTMASGKTKSFESQDQKTGKKYITTVTPINKNFYFAATKDITELKKTEEDLNRVNRTLKSLNGINHSLLRANDEKEFLAEVCRIIVKDCGHKLVWIGFANNDEEKTVKPVSWAGFEKGYLETLNLTWADRDRGRGPTGTAIRNGKPQLCRNMLTDPNFAPWRDEALKRGYASSIAMPLVIKGNMLGAITIYSKYPDPFTIDEIDLLTQLAADTAYGIYTLNLRQKHKAAVEKLRETGEYLDNLINYANAPIIVWDHNFKITKFNTASEKLTGLKSKQVTGKSLGILFPAKSKKESMEMIRSTLAGKRWEVAEIPIKRIDGDIRTVVWNSANIMGDSENIISTIAQGQDITDRKRAEEKKAVAEFALKTHAQKLEKAVAELENLHLAVENASDIIFVADPGGIILSINKAVEQLLGYDPREIVGKKMRVLGKASNQKHFDKMWEIIKENKKGFMVEIANQNGNGRKMIFELHISPVLDKKGEIIFLVGVVRDRTEAKESDLAKTEFISLAAHQLRTPLSTISMASEMLTSGNIGKIDGDAKEQLQEICSTAHKMAEMIELFLNISRIELGRLDINPEMMDVADFAREMAREIAAQAAAKKITIKTEFSENLPEINIDRKIMHIALENLLTNAIKYTAHGGKIVFSVREDKGNIISSVADDGCGIPKSELPLLFNKMFRATNVGEAKGLGLGLNMTKSAIEQCGGSISVQTEENKGSKFSISIPLSGMKKARIKIEP